MERLLTSKEKKETFKETERLTENKHTRTLTKFSQLIRQKNTCKSERYTKEVKGTIFLTVKHTYKLEMNARLAAAGFLSLISAIWLYTFTERSPTQAFYRPHEQAAIALAIIGLILLAIGLFPEEKKRI